MKKIGDNKETQNRGVKMSFLTFNEIHEVQQHCGYQSNYKKVEGKPMQKRHNQQWHSQVSNKTLKKKGNKKT